MAKSQEKIRLELIESEEKDMQERKIHSKIIDEKCRNMKRKYVKWWDLSKRKWKDGFKGHGDSRKI
tara:strand:- start:1189 stop:1386 length:198 start_codon:yes stop_codon:yes gene_type:complete